MFHLLECIIILWWRDGRGNAGRTTSKSGHSCPCQNCSEGPPVQKTARGSQLNRPSCPPDDPIGQGIELNRLTALMARREYVASWLKRWMVNPVAKRSTAGCDRVKDRFKCFYFILYSSSESTFVLCRLASVCMSLVSTARINIVAHVRDPTSTFG